MAKHQLTKKQIEVLKDIVGTEEQVHQWHQEFLRDFPNGEVSKAGLAKAFKELNPGCEGSVEKLSAFAFKAFDTNNDGKLSFEEFLVGVILFMNDDNKLGKVAKKKQVDLFFNLFDTNNDGQISVSELQKVLTAFYSIASEDQEAELIGGGQAADIIKKLDKDGSGTLNREELAKALANIDGILLFSDFDQE